MTHDDLIELYRRAGASQAWLDAVSVSYRAGAAAEREACANLCEDIGSKDDTFYREESGSGYCADAIRARGEA